jgi:hypothetical protein
MTTLRRSASPPRSRSGRLLPVIAVGTAVGAILALVFAAYLRPEFAFDLASRFIQCF